MEGIATVHILRNCVHEPVVVGRGLPSVSFLRFTLSFPAYPLGSASAIARGFAPDAIEKVQGAFDELGPTARLCISYVANPCQLDLYESRRPSTLEGLSISDLIQAVREIRDLNFNVSLSHTLFLIRRVELNPWDERYLQRYIVEPITSHVRQELKLKLMKAQQEERLHVYKAFEPIPQLRRLASLAFESIVQFQLQKEVELTLVPMVRQPPTTKRRSAQWKSQSVQDLVPMSTEDSSSVGVIAANGLPIDLKPHNTIQFPSPRPSEVSSGVYYVPESPNQVGFDSFIVENGVLYIFQSTIAASHPIKEGLMDFFSHKSLHKILEDKEWYFIFVIPQGGELMCSESGDEKLKEIRKHVEFFTVEVDPAKTRVAHGSDSNVVSSCIIL